MDSRRGISVRRERKRTNRKKPEKEVVKDQGCEVTRSRTKEENIESVAVH